MEKLAVAIERPELVEDPRFLTNPDRVQNRSELETIVSEFFAKRTVQENLNYFEERGITVGPICNIADLIKHPFILGRQVVKTYADPDHGALPDARTLSKALWNAWDGSHPCTHAGRKH